MVLKNAYPINKKRICFIKTLPVTIIAFVRPEAEYLMKTTEFRTDIPGHRRTDFYTHLHNVRELWIQEQRV